ncbi:hypothetical protein [Desmospora profundinema]|uniref:Uncharacterized protein n=1 Tax=Desmospora profundinema TaxID=1571184 RepID=A0ABU1IH55_9BACL|nr:hypothetical protein [Desmospora profundinema]MDR6224112.1 hypothetical protein [Desmospora profundinema]
MVKKKKRNKSEQPKQKSNRRKRIKESDLYESRVVAPLRSQLRRAQQGGHLQVVDEIWGKLQDAQKHHRILIARGTFVERP